MALLERDGVGKLVRSILTLVEDMSLRVIGVSGRLDKQDQKINLLTDLVKALQVDLAERGDQLRAEQMRQGAVIDQILSELLTPPPPPPNPAVGFRIELHSELLSNTNPQGETPNTTMPKLKASIDFQLKDDGSAVAVLKPFDAAGLDTAFDAGAKATFTSSDPNVLADLNADNLSATVHPATPPVLVTGAVITVSVTLVDGSVLGPVSSDPIDVVPDVAVGFKIALS